MRNNALRTVVLLLVAVGIVAQPTPRIGEPVQVSVQNPCSTSDLKAAQAEADAAAKAALAEACSLHAEVVVKEAAILKGKLNEAGQKLVIEQGKIAEKDQAIAGHVKTNAEVAVERDRALLKIKKANGRWNCELLHLGCIDER